MFWLYLSSWILPETWQIDRYCQLLCRSRGSHDTSSLSSEEALSRSSHPNKESSPRVQKEVERESKIFASPLCQSLPTFWVLILSEEKLLVWQLVGCRFFLSATFLKHVCCKQGFVILGNIKRNLWLSQPQGMTFLLIYPLICLSEMQIISKALQCIWVIKTLVV